MKAAHALIGQSIVRAHGNLIGFETPSAYSSDEHCNQFRPPVMFTFFDALRLTIIESNMLVALWYYKDRLKKLLICVSQN